MHLEIIESGWNDGSIKLVVEQIEKEMISPSIINPVNNMVQNLMLKDPKRIFHYSYKHNSKEPTTNIIKWFRILNHARDFSLGKQICIFAKEKIDNTYDYLCLSYDLIIPYFKSLESDHMVYHEVLNEFEPNKLIIDIDLKESLDGSIPTVDAFLIYCRNYFVSSLYSFIRTKKQIKIDKNDIIIESASTKDKYSLHIKVKNVYLSKLDYVHFKKDFLVHLHKVNIYIDKTVTDYYKLFFKETNDQIIHPIDINQHNQMRLLYHHKQKSKERILKLVKFEGNQITTTNEFDENIFLDSLITYKNNDQMKLIKTNCIEYTFEERTKIDEEYEKIFMKRKLMSKRSNVFSDLNENKSKVFIKSVATKWEKINSVNKHINDLWDHNVFRYFKEIVPDAKPEPSGLRYRYYKASTSSSCYKVDYIFRNSSNMHCITKSILMSKYSDIKNHDQKKTEFSFIFDHDKMIFHYYCYKESCTGHKSPIMAIDDPTNIIRCNNQIFDSIKVEEKDIENNLELDEELIDYIKKEF